MKLILAPPGSSLCGQACVAMAAGVSLRRAIEAVGHERGTHTVDVARGLRALGLDCEDRCKRVSKHRPIPAPRALLAFRRGQRIAHWMLLWDGAVFDPGGWWPDNMRDWKMTSYLRIYD